MAAPMPSAPMGGNALLRPDQGPGRFGPAAAPPPAGNLRPPPLPASPNPVAGGPLNPPANALVRPAPGPVAPMLPGVQGPGLPTNSLPPQAVRSPAGLEHRVSTRIPTAVGLAYDPHTRPDLSIGHMAMVPEGMAPHHFTQGHDKAVENVTNAHQKHADLIRKEYPFINTEGLTNHGVLERFVEHAHDNIVDLWNRVRDKPWRDAAANWYWGANKLAGDMAQRYGVSHRQAAAAIAALSPQKDWNENVSFAERTMNTHANHQNSVVTPEMREIMQAMVDARHPTRRQELEQYINGGTHAETGEVYKPIAVGDRYADLTHPMQKAAFIRAMDDAHATDRGYHIIHPDGRRIRAVNDQGEDKPVRWGGLGATANAIRALESNDHLPTISRALGAQHKVRNFYNNIIAPDAAHYLGPHHGDITADTHAINVGLMFPMGSGHRIVGQGLGGGPGTSGPNATGAKGLYGLHADAYRRAAQTISAMEGRGYLPREVQSVVWEAIRGLWKKEHKKLDKNGMPAHEVGQAAQGAAYAIRHGFMPPQMARDAVVQAAGGIRDPDWHRGTGVVEEDE